MPTTSDIDPSRISDSAWRVVEITPHYRRSVVEIEPGKFIQKTEYLADESLQEENRQLYDASFGKRFGDGVVAGRIPLNLLFSGELAAKLKEGDRDHLSWWLNRDENRPFRTFRGKL